MKTIVEYEVSDIDKKDPRNITLLLGLTLAAFTLADKTLSVEDRGSQAIVDFLNLLNKSGYTVVKDS